MPNERPGQFAGMGTLMKLRACIDVQKGLGCGHRSDLHPGKALDDFEILGQERLNKGDLLT